MWNNQNIGSMQTSSLERMNEVVRPIAKAITNGAWNQANMGIEMNMEAWRWIHSPRIASNSILSETNPMSHRSHQGGGGAEIPLTARDIAQL